MNNRSTGHAEPGGRLNVRHRARRSTALAVAAAMAFSGAVAAAAGPAAADDGVSSHLVLKYDLNEVSGTTAHDTSGHGSDGTLTGGASWSTSGKTFGGAMLDGTNGYVNLPNTTLSGVRDVTMSLNVKPSASKHQWYGTLGYSSSRYLGVEQNGDTLTAYWTNGSTFTVSGSFAPAVGTWANVAVVESSTDHTLKLYIDGVLKATRTGTTGDLSTLYDSTKTSGGYIGNSVWGGDPYLAATVDDFRVYDAALTDAQVAAVAASAPVDPAATTPVTSSTSPGVAPSLPGTVNVPATDGTTQVLPVTWDALDPSQYANPGTIVVHGTTAGASPLAATATVYVLPTPALTTTGKSTTTVDLAWGAQDDVATYRLYRSTTPGAGYTQVYGGADTSFTDTGLSLATHYYYVLDYTTTAGGSSVRSNELSVKTDTVLVGPPTITQSSYLQTYRIQLSWNPVDLADSYQVYRSDTAAGTYAKVGSVTGTTFKDNDVEQSSTYYYKVAAVNDAGEGPASDPLAARTAVDSVPRTTVTSSAQTDSEITLDWDPKDGALGYSLYRSSTSGSGYSLVYSGPDTSFTDENLVTGSTYYYVVTYTTDLGTSVNSKELSVSTVAVKVPAPSAIQLVASYANAIKLGWNSVVGATSFTIYRSTSADGSYTVVSTTTGNSYTDKDLSAGTTYYYRLTSVNAAGESTPSQPFPAATDPGTSTIVTNSTTWYDVDGDPIKAGSGDIIEYQGTYYWYGTGADEFDINVYSSSDLVHWKFENAVVSAHGLGTDGQPAADLDPANGHFFERPKVVYNPSTQQFVLVVHYENSDYTLAEIGTAFSDSPTGNFTWAHAFRPGGLDSRDSTAYVDVDGTGYIISSTLTNSKLSLFKLTPDFLSVDEQLYNIYGGPNSSDIYSGREAPAIVKKDGIYYLVTSSAAGWYPSPAMYSTAEADTLADTTVDSWKGDVNVDALGGWDGGGYGWYLGNRNAFGGQSVYIVPVTGTHGTSYLLMSDTLDPKASGVGGPLWLPLKLDDGVATLDYSSEISINAKAGETSNVYQGSLLSQGKKSWASSADTIDSDGNTNADGWTGQYANDGDYNTEWKASSSSYPAWWEVDLGQEYVINNVQLSWWMIGGSEATQDFQIQVSDDGVNWSVGYDLSSGDKQYGFNNCLLPGVQGRYVRVWIIASRTQNNNGGWYVPQLYEARVFGDAAPTSATTTTANIDGSYSLAVPSNIANYPATGHFTLSLGPVSVKFPTADLLSNLGHGTLTAVNGVTSADTLAAVTSAAGTTSKVVDAFDLGLRSADGTAVTSLGSPATVTVQLTDAQVAALTAAGTPKVFRYEPGSAGLVDTAAVFDLATGTASFGTTSLGTFVVAATGLVPPALTVLTGPAITGNATVGQTLSVTPGTYSVPEVTVTYQWLRNGSAIKDATGATYAVTASDYEARLSVQVTASTTGYTSVTTTTAQTSPVAAGTFTVLTLPAITGNATVGQTLSVTPGTYSVPEVTATYQWLRNGSAIKDATGATYAVTGRDLRARLSVRVTAATTGYASVTTTTAQTSPVRAGWFSVRPNSASNGGATAGQTFPVSPGSAVVAGTSATLPWLGGATEGSMVFSAPGARW